MRIVQAVIAIQLRIERDIVGSRRTLDEYAMSISSVATKHAA